MAKSEGEKAIGGLISLIILGVAAWYFFGGGLESNVADDAIQQYQMVKRSGTPMDTCVHAGIVRDAYLQAKDEDNYQKWQTIERTDCQIAGVPETP